MVGVEYIRERPSQEELVEGQSHEGPRLVLLLTDSKSHEQLHRFTLHHPQPSLRLITYKC